MIKPTGIWGDVGEQSLLNPSSRFSAMLHDLPNYIIQSAMMSLGGCRQLERDVRAWWLGP